MLALAGDSASLSSMGFALTIVSIWGCGNVAMQSDFIVIGRIKPHAMFLISYTYCKLSVKVQKRELAFQFPITIWLDVGVITNKQKIVEL